MALHDTQMLILGLQFPPPDLNMNPFTKLSLSEMSLNALF